ncbi:MAG: type II secretion system protein [Acidobacteriota bacterium]
MKEQSQGFSLLELLVVIGMLGILTAIAVPNLLAARRSANEASAIASLKSFLNAEHTYFGTHSSFTSPGILYTEGFISDDFGETFTAEVSLGDPVVEVDEELPPEDIPPEAADDTPVEDTPYTICFSKSGYIFVMVPVEVGAIIDTFGRMDGFTVLEFYMISYPQSDTEGGLYRTGTRRFYIDSFSNTPWIVKHLNPDGTDNGKYDCYDESADAPTYGNCTPVDK